MDWLARTRDRLERGSIDLERALAGLAALEAAGVDTAGWREVLAAPIDLSTRFDDGLAHELVAVIPGPAEYRAGHRVLVVLRFANAVILMIDRDVEAAPDIDEPFWRLTDDLGTEYRHDAFGGGWDEDDVWFSTPPPDAARWLEVTLDGVPEATVRVAL